MFNPSRDEVREMFFGAWRKYREGVLAAGMEGGARRDPAAPGVPRRAQTRPRRYRDRDYTDEANLFLHMSLHLALEEQLLDRPASGIAHRFQVLLKFQDRHDALHQALECLAETLWRAQRDAAPPDAGAYLSCLERRVGT
jgi:hypothetical protein